jgi:hypothetical protein
MHMFFSSVDVNYGAIPSLYYKPYYFKYACFILFLVLFPRFKLIVEMELVQKRKNEKRREKGQMIVTKKK